MASAPQVHVTPEKVMKYAWGYAPPLILAAAVRSRVFDVLDAGPKTVAETSAATGASERGLTSIMNALVGLEFLTRDDAGVYALTADSAAFLVGSKPGYLGGMLKHMSRQLIPLWLGLDEIVQTGRPASRVNQENEGSAFFEEFVSDIFPMSYPSAVAAGVALGVASAKGPVRVLDLAAGSGVWGIAIAQQSPHVTVTAVDWPAVLETTRKTAQRFGLADRFHFVAGDLATADFGTGHQIATLGHILHSEGAERSRNLLRKTFDALAPGGSIVIGEFLVDADRRGPVNGLIFSVNMLVNTDEGDTFSFEEIRGWLEQCGFENARLVPAPGPSPLIVAEKPAK
jgi:SAM-dependent methyltransferase